MFISAWLCCSWAIVDWDSAEQASDFHGFVASAPQGKFLVIDMSVNGEGQWRQWDNASFFGSNFVWTTLHDFGGTDGMKVLRCTFHALSKVAALAPPPPAHVTRACACMCVW